MNRPEPEPMKRRKFKNIKYKNIKALSNHKFPPPKMTNLNTGEMECRNDLHGRVIRSKPYLQPHHKHKHLKYAKQ